MSMALLMFAVAWLSTRCSWSCNYMDLRSVFLVRMAGPNGLRRKARALICRKCGFQLQKLGAELWRGGKQGETDTDLMQKVRASIRCETAGSPSDSQVNAKEGEVERLALT